MEKERIDIHGLAFGGAGVGRLADGRVCFVPYTSPGDTVDAEIVRRKKSFCEGRLLSVVVASPSRTAPPCPVFGRCGGCQLQHLQYDAQLAAKEEIFASALQRGAGIPRSAVAPIQSSPAPFGYRSRIQLKLHHDGKRFHCGFFAPDSHFVVDCGGFCPISAEPVNRTLAHLVDILQSFPDPRKLPQVDIASGDGASVNLVFHYIGELPEAAGWFRQAADSLPAAAGVYVQRGRKSSMETVAGDGFLRYAMPAAEGRMLDLRFGAGCFSQVNLEQNREMWLRRWRGQISAPVTGCSTSSAGTATFPCPRPLRGVGWRGTRRTPPPSRTPAPTPRPTASPTSGSRPHRAPTPC
ncbi:MAG TPA: TRAM domain-containing protein, partial [Verrucomicrobiae bacterium]|nr:TRAM domain-containing protein [Verrucomicrobiae bacterium]